MDTWDKEDSRKLKPVTYADPFPQIGFESVMLEFEILPLSPGRKQISADIYLQTPMGESEPLHICDFVGCGSHTIVFVI